MATQTGRVILGGWAKQLIKAGVVPPDVRRILIDIAADDVVKVYYECYGDDKMFTAELAVALEKAEVVGIKDAGKPKPTHEQIDDMCRDTYPKETGEEVDDDPSVSEDGY